MPITSTSKPALPSARGVRRALATTTTAALAITSLTACTDIAATGATQAESAQIQSLATICPDHPLLTILDKDASGSQVAPQIEAAALGVVREHINLAAACAAKVGTGHVTVRLFATNAAQTATLLDTDITVGGATDIARLRKVVRDGTADALFAKVTSAYPEMIANLPVKASDVLSQFPLAAEAEQQMEQNTGQDYALNLVVLSDGFATTPKQLGKVKTVADAEDLAEQTRSSSPPGDLNAWRVSMVGVGRVAGDKQPSTAKIDVIKAFWRKYLDGTAEQVIVATDFPGTSGTTAAGGVTATNNSSASAGSPAATTVRATASEGGVR